MATRLFVGNLPYSATDQSLGEKFSSAGTVVSANVITDRMSGRSKGFGFVEMGSEDEAKKAIESLNGQDFDGRPMVVNEARPREDRGGGDAPRESAPAAEESSDSAPAEDAPVEDASTEVASEESAPSDESTEEKAA